MTLTAEQVWAEMNARERAEMCYLFTPEDADPMGQARRDFVRTAGRVARRVPVGEDFERDTEYRFALAMLKWTVRLEERR